MPPHFCIRAAFAPPAIAQVVAILVNQPFWINAFYWQGAHGRARAAAADCAQPHPAHRNIQARDLGPSNPQLTVGTVSLRYHTVYRYRTHTRYRGAGGWTTLHYYVGPLITSIAVGLTIPYLLPQFP